MNNNYKTNVEESVLKEIGIDKSVSNFAIYQIPYKEAERIQREEVVKFKCNDCGYEFYDDYGIILCPNCNGSNIDYVIED